MSEFRLRIYFVDMAIALQPMWCMKLKKPLQKLQGLLFGSSTWARTRDLRINRKQYFQITPYLLIIFACFDRCVINCVIEEILLWTVSVCPESGRLNHSGRLSGVKNLDQWVRVSRSGMSRIWTREQPQFWTLVIEIWVPQDQSEKGVAVRFVSSDFNTPGGQITVEFAIKYT